MPDTPEEISELTDAAAAGPAQVSVAGNSVTAQRVPDLIALENHRAAQASVGQGHFGLRFTKLVPPGCG